jgi:hypothetical protein
VVDQLREGVPLRTPRPAQEVSTLRRSLDRATVTLELLEDTGGQPIPATVPKGGADAAPAGGPDAGVGRADSDRIGEALGLSPATVRTYVSRAIEKLGAADRGHAVVLGVSLGLISLPK